MNIDQKSDDMAQKEEERSAPSSWDRPLLLAGLGLALMLGGYTAMNYVVAGRLAFFAGLVLFVAAGILMYRSAPSTKDGEDAE